MEPQTGLLGEGRDHPVINALLWTWVVVMLFAVAYFSLAPPSDDGLAVPDKVVHFFSYAGLTLSLLSAAVWAPVRGNGPLPHGAALVVATATFFGILIEVIQGPVPERDAELLDAVANAGGATLALFIWGGIRMTRPSISSES